MISCDELNSDEKFCSSSSSVKRKDSSVRSIFSAGVPPVDDGSSMSLLSTENGGGTVEFILGSVMLSIVGIRRIFCDEGKLPPPAGA